MAYYVEFEVDDEEAEERFWECIHTLGQCAETFAQSGKWTDLYDMEQAAFDLAREMGYNVDIT